MEHLEQENKELHEEVASMRADIEKLTNMVNCWKLHKISHHLLLLSTLTLKQLCLLFLVGRCSSVLQNIPCLKVSPWACPLVLVKCFAAMSLRFHKMQFILLRLVHYTLRLL
jgi:hypothetical protein